MFYIDYGNCEWISWNQFTDIHKKFWDLAPQAVPFKLAGKFTCTSSCSTVYSLQWWFNIDPPTCRGYTLIWPKWVCAGQQENSSQRL